MADSKLVTREWWANQSNYTVGRSDKVGGIVIHHAASTSLDSVGAVFSQYGRGGSAHYGVKGKQVHQYVHECDTAWHCGDWYGNSYSIGIETVNSTGAPNWLVDDETFETLAYLCADIAARYNLAIKFEPDGTYPTLSAHRDWSATYCPGDYLYGKMYELENKINLILHPATAKITWKEIKPITIYLAAKEPTILYDFNHTHAENVKKVKEFKKGTEFEIKGEATNATIGKTYLVTTYSFDNKKTNGFNVGDLIAKAPDPEPTPPEPDPPAPDPDPDPTVGILQKIVDFILHIIELITKKQGE